MKELYFALATGLSFVALLHIPSRLPPVRNVSAILAFVFGWALWPVFWFAALRSQN